METKRFLVFDFGASNGRASVAAFDGNKFDFEIVHRFENIPVYASGTLYWDFLKLFSELKAGLSAGFKKYDDISSLGIDTWGVDFGLLDKNGKLISNPIHYRDEKRNSLCDEVFDIIPKEKLFDLTGCAMASYYSIFNLYSLKIQNSTEYVNADKFLMMPELFSYFLTGEAISEYTIAHGTLMCNPFTMDWEDEIIKKLDFPDNIFAGIVQPGTKIGKLQKGVCDELEINSVPVIAPAMHDTPSAIVGIPVVKNKENTVFMSVGTWGITTYEMDKPDVSKEVYDSGFANEGGAEGKTLLFKNFTGLWLIQKCRDRWVRDLGDDLSWDDIMELAEKTETLDSYIDVDEQAFILENFDMPGAVVKYCSEKGQGIPQNPGEVARVIYESFALKVRQSVEKINKLTSRKMQSIHMVGGGTKDRLLCQWISDAAKLPVNTGPTETTSVGNLLMQLKASGDIKTMEEGRQICLNSSSIKTYTPQDTAQWDVKYGDFLKVI
jgi:sugar (pentulose or hexulose) kinase